MASSVRRAAGQIVVTFPKEDIHLVRKLEEYCNFTGATMSAAVRKCIAAVVEQDERTMSALKDFTSALARGARSKVHA